MSSSLCSTLNGELSGPAAPYCPKTSLRCAPVRLDVSCVAFCWLTPLFVETHPLRDSWERLHQKWIYWDFSHLKNFFSLSSHSTGSVEVIFFKILKALLHCLPVNKCVKRNLNAIPISDLFYLPLEVFISLSLVFSNLTILHFLFSALGTWSKFSCITSFQFLLFFLSRIPINLMLDFLDWFSGFIFSFLF